MSLEELFRRLGKLELVIGERAPVRQWQEVEPLDRAVLEVRSTIRAALKRLS